MSFSSSQLRTSQTGLGLVEIVVVSGIISVVFVGLLQLLILTLRPVEQSVRQAQASYLNEEAIEAVKVLRNQGWTANIAPLTRDTTYYPVVVSDNWTLTTTSPGVINDVYTRTLVFEDVYRDGNDNIAASGSGTLDPKTLKVTATTTWTDHEVDKELVIETYITNFRDS